MDRPTEPTDHGKANNNIHAFQPFLVGLSPSYWSHVPMLIRQVHQLQLVDGIHCAVTSSTNYDHHRLVQQEQQSMKKLLRQSPPPHYEDPEQQPVRTATATTTSIVNQNILRYMPVSKCKLVGMLVAIEDRPGSRSVIYVLDDGTGVIDCFQWRSSGDDDDGLPLHLEDHNNNRDCGGCGFVVGQLVEVHGRIDCAAIFDGSRVQRQEIGGPVIREFRDCLREIRVSGIRVLPAAHEAIPGSPQHSELEHWKKAIQFGDGTRIDHVLGMLGTTIQSQILELAAHPCIRDQTGAWQLFGIKCQCHNLGYKEPLLYCHCMASRGDDSSSLDPDLEFRDALLEFLLRLEETNQNNSLEPLRFQYRNILDHVQRGEIASKYLNNWTHDKMKQLLHSTFRYLRKDGVVYLVDHASDTYVLISRRRCLEPHIAASLVQPSAGQRPVSEPIYWSTVPHARIQYIKRSLSFV